MASLEKTTNLNNQLTSPEELRDFLNKGMIARVGRLLRHTGNFSGFLLSEDGDNGRFLLDFKELDSKRVMIVQNSLSRIPGLFLKLPVDPLVDKLASGEISSYFTTIDTEERRVPMHYWQDVGIVKKSGNPNAVVQVLGVVEEELSNLAGILPGQDI
jgi:hypothetical protein